ncbi:TonB-dependent receptor [Olivibacter ginsenosidimutans]|uniref:TonB-dependent receptor n=2 Tax=Olivibacter ginsenosidimutans TaxID=1176537 RepID=A0ABP9AYY5_9SPHI
MLLLSPLLKAQAVDGIISGRIAFENDEPIAGASIRIAGSKQGTKSDSNGRFVLTVPSGASYRLQINYMGTAKRTINADLTKQKETTLQITLFESTNELDEVTIQGQTTTQKAKTQIVKAEVVDTKAHQQEASTLVELMNRSAGIRIRQSGGLGSDNNIMLNGFQGKSIKTFKDGVPTDYLGAAFNLSTLPVNMLEHVEVYKGVLPTQLGADALGGAVNLVSRLGTQPYLAASYELASFNTHRATINWYHRSDNSKLFGGLDAFFNYSDNSYQVTADIPNEETANVIPEKVKLFHNAYRQWYAEAYGGWKDVFWADEFRLGITTFYMKRDNQFAALMERPFGAAYSRQKAPIIPTLRYKKSLLNGKLIFDQFAVYSSINNLLVDTLSGSYDWYGQYHAPVDAGKRGESGNASLADIRFSNLTTRTGINYQLNEQHGLTFNLVFNDYNRKGSDPYGAVSAGENPVDLQSLPADYTKVVGALGLSSTFLEKRLQNLVQVKYYQANAVGQEVNLSTGRLREETSKAKSSTFGAAEALKWNINPNTFFRLSGEYATRLPEQQEILGNGNFVLANFGLNPERSVNGNLGFGYNKGNHYGVEVNSFYRITKDMIISVPVNLIYSQSSNVEQVRGIGLETDAYVQAFKWLRLNGNFTYQDFRLYHVTEPSILYLERARLRNVPYFFANLGATFNVNNTISNGDHLQAYWYFSYVHEYYLNYIPKDTEPDGFLGLWGDAKIDAPNIIPGQNVHTVGVVWNPSPSQPLSINLECKNLFDAAVYDNFRIQNAGRSFHLKLNYILNYSHNK